MQNSYKEGSYLTGLLGALLGAIVCSIPWAIVYSLGWFVALLGLLIGFGASMGYTLLKGKAGAPAAIIVLLAIILGVAIGQILGDFITIGKMINSGELMGEITYGDIPKMWKMVMEESSEARTEFLTNFGLGLVFAGLGSWKIIVGVLQHTNTQTVSPMPPVLAGAENNWQPEGSTPAPAETESNWQPEVPSPVNVPDKAVLGSEITPLE